MDFRILGPLEALDGGRVVALGGPKQRALLGLFLLHRGETLSSDRLIDELWGERPPATATKSVQVYISRLRKALARGNGDASAGTIVTREHGYELRLDPERLDAHRFERLVAEARSDLAAGRPKPAVSALEAALSLWRGPPLADLAYEPFAQREAARLDDLRLEALETLIEAKLALGAHAEVVGRLHTLIGDHPFRERLRAQLMLALYRCDRQADALQAYQDARRTLVDELGIEPSERLRELEQAILAQDPRLHLPVAEEPATADRAAEPSRGTFVGRERELAELVGGLDDAFAGHGRVFLLAGEPGIGKSLLAEELIADARTRGARVLVGRCWEAGGAPAYWPWVQALRAYVREAEPEQLRAQLGDGAADLAQLLPELRALLPGIGEPPAPESEGARFRLFDVTSSFLVSASKACPLVIVLDDLHAADEPSLLLLQFVARELGASRVLIVGAYRDVDPTLADPLRPVLRELAREPLTRSIELTGLGKADVARFLELAAPGVSAADLAPTVHAETEGNPLFVGEILRLLATEHRLEDPATPLAIPQSVREVIGRRLRHLSHECNELLALASVLGREFDLDALVRIGGLERDALLELLDEATDARVVSEVPGVIGRMRFAHALIRDAAYHGMARGRRVQLHRQVGEGLEALYASDLDPHLAELAHHFFEAAAGGHAQTAVAYARRAGARAVDLLAYEEAVRLYEMALEALGPESAATARSRCDLLLALANARGRAGDNPGARASFLKAAELARSAGLPEVLGRAALGYGGRFVWDRAMSDERLVPLLQDALAALGEVDSALRVQLLARLAAALRGEPSRRRRELICEEAIQTARRIGDPAAAAYALAAAEAALHAPHTAQRRLEEAREIVTLASATGDRERLFDGHEHAFWAAWELGDPAERAVQLASMIRVAEELRQPAQLWMVAVAQATLALAEGRFAEAAELIDQAAAVGERVQSWSAAAVAHTLPLFLLRREQGRLEDFEREIQGPGHEFSGPLVRHSVRAHVHARLGRTEQAEAALHELTSRDLADWHVDEEWLVGICLLAETCVILEDTERAAPLYDLLLPYASLNAVAVPELALDSTSRPLGILAALLGRFEDAVPHFEEALRMNERMGARPWLAHAREDYARMLLRRDADGDRERAEKLLGQAHATYDELGMS
jgi:DNA-binding SARP family transcriptional activator